MQTKSYSQLVSPLNTQIRRSKARNYHQRLSHRIERKQNGDVSQTSHESKTLTLTQS